MPELPEVATVIKYLNQHICQETILGVKIIRDKFLKNISAPDFIEQVTNQAIMNIERYGKHIIFNLSHDRHFVSHLRMEGRWYVVNDQFDFSNKHVHLIFQLSHDKYLCYVDTRQFGTIFYFGSQAEMEASLKAKTGLDALDPLCDGDYLYECYHHSKLPIKAALLDQSKIMGIGNIYANEICFALNLDPNLPFCQLGQDRYAELATVTKHILESAIMQNGTTVHSFEFGLKKTGEFQNELVVYGHAHEPCPVCGDSIQKCEIKQRGTYYCPTCQHVK